MHDEIRLNYEGPDGETIRVTASVSLTHPELCTFTASKPLLPGYSAYFPAKSAGKGSPLIDELFNNTAIEGVVVGDQQVKISLRHGNDWEEHVATVGAAIRDAVLSEDPAIAQAVIDDMLPPEDLQKRVQNVLDTLINPAVAGHGGVVRLLDVSNNTLFLEFGGGCQGCGMANVTLRYGVERTIREEVPEVGDILDATDHAAGRNPYYAPQQT